MKTSTVLRYLFPLLLSHVFQEAASEKTAYTRVNLPQGKIKGLYDPNSDQIIFLGIPYASVTERFQDPGSPPSWNNTFAATQGRIMCSQYSASKILVGQEDCLVLNVFTPPSLEQKPFPVMVFVPGGGFLSGSNSELEYDPRFLVKKKVIVVTINYRLGAFGFLCLGLKEAPGNVGLRDQLAALKWVQNNIAYFGGDPDSVTVFGESAGAVSIHHFLLTGSFNGLFHRAILQSGTVLMPHDFSYEPIKSASKVASRLGYNTSDPTELLKIFKNASAYDIVKASKVDRSNNAFAPYIFTPCVETDITNRAPLITEKPTQLLNKQIGLNVPVIIGFNNKEGINWAQYYNIQTLNKLKANFDKMIPSYLVFDKENDKTTFIDDVAKLYFCNRTIEDGLIGYFTDSLIAFPVTLTSESFLRNSIKELYNYYFEHDSLRNLNKLKTRLATTPGACHGDELFYLFQTADLVSTPPIPNDAATIKNMTVSWTNFAKTGKPLTCFWRSSGEYLQFLQINKEIKMTTLPNEDRIAFWKKSYEKYGRK